ncbi:hypothetical protein M5D96_001558, partial [Drosophila gunungcola]
KPPAGKWISSGTPVPSTDHMHRINLFSFTFAETRLVQVYCK